MLHRDFEVVRSAWQRSFAIVDTDFGYHIQALHGGLY